MREHATQLGLLFRRQLVRTLVQCSNGAVDRRDGRAQLVGRNRGELALQLVQPPQLAVLDRPLEERGDQRAEGCQEVDLRRVERKGLAALVARQEAETAPVAHERDDHERADPESPCDLFWYLLPNARNRHEHRPARCECILERAELGDRKGRRKRAELCRRQAVRCKRDEHRGFRDVADDPDAFEREAVRDRGTRTLEHSACTELPSRQRARQPVEGFELDVRLGSHITHGRLYDSRRSPTVGRDSGRGKACCHLTAEPRS